VSGRLRGNNGLQSLQGLPSQAAVGPFCLSGFPNHLLSNNISLVSGSGSNSLDNMECDSPHLLTVSSSNNSNASGVGSLSNPPPSSSGYQMSSRSHGSAPTNVPPPGLGSVPPGAYHLQSRLPNRALPPPHIITAALLESGGMQSLNSRLNYGGPSSLSDFASLASTVGSNPNFQSYLPMNLNNADSGPPSVGSLECTQTGSLNMPLLSQPSSAAGLQAFTNNMNMNGLISTHPPPPHQHHGTSGLNFPLPPSSSHQFLTSYNSPSNAPVGSIPQSLPYGLVQHGGGGGSGGGSYGGNSAASSTSSDLGGNSSKGQPQTQHLLMSLSSRTTLQGQRSSEEEDDESPMVCVQQQSPVGVASH